MGGILSKECNTFVTIFTVIFYFLKIKKLKK